MSLTTPVRLLARASVAWWEDNALRLGAALAYYTLFSVAPILIVAIAVAGTLFGAEAVRGEIVGELGQLIGQEGGRAVQALLQGSTSRAGNLRAGMVGGATFFLAACGAFLELQAALNTIWRVTPAPAPGTRQVVDFVLDRFRSFGLVIATGFLLLLSLAASAALAALGTWLGRWAPGIPLLLHALNLVISLAGTTVLFGLLFKFLPDVELRWADVAAGATVTAVLFAAGTHVIGYYLGGIAIASTYGAAGSVVALLLWVYYSSQIVLLGAEFTRLYADRFRGHVPPSAYATVTAGTDST